MSRFAIFIGASVAGAGCIALMLIACGTPSESTPPSEIIVGAAAQLSEGTTDSLSPSPGPKHCSDPDIDISFDVELLSTVIEDGLVTDSAKWIIHHSGKDEHRVTIA
ncbi:MAG: hypothetical protein OXI59_20510, partial [Gemmatimonadota bacterium]|nr:hypothetical protein [Gemmatimonadota bacterium]